MLRSSTRRLTTPPKGLRSHLERGAPVWPIVSERQKHETSPAGSQSAPSHPPLPAEAPGPEPVGCPSPRRATYRRRVSLRAFRPPCHRKSRQTRRCHSRKCDDLIYLDLACPYQAL